MKRIFANALVLILAIFLLAACSTNNDDLSSASTTNEPSTGGTEPSENTYFYESLDISKFDSSKFDGVIK